MKNLDLKKIIEKIILFRNQRNWDLYPSSKDMIVALYCEIAELAEHFQYYTDTAFKEKNNSDIENMADEIIDILWWILLLAHKYKINTIVFLNKKIIKKTKFYPKNSLLIMFSSVGKISLETMDTKDTITKTITTEINNIFNQLILLSKFLNLDIEKEFFRKLKKNNKKYPIKDIESTLLKLFKYKLGKHK